MPLIDAYLPGMKGLDLLKLLHDRDDRLPTIVIAGESDVRLAVRAMKAGASGFIEKPIGPIELLECVGRAFEQSLSSRKLFAWRMAHGRGEPHLGAFAETTPDHESRTLGVPQ